MHPSNTQLERTSNSERNGMHVTKSYAVVRLLRCTTDVIEPDRVSYSFLVVDDFGEMEMEMEQLL